MQKLFETFIKPGQVPSLGEVLQEARSTYFGHLEATIDQFGSSHTAKDLDNLLQGEGCVVHTANDCYEYAINGKIKLASSEVEAESSSHDWRCLASLLLAARYGIEFFSPEVDGYGVGVPVHLEQLFFHAILRARLDIDTLPELDQDLLPGPLRDQATGYLNLKEIAVLAQMDEKSVRNATQPKAPDRLFTVKLGSRTMVESHEALRWLKGRRHFITTTLQEV